LAIETIDRTAEQVRSPVRCAAEFGAVLLGGGRRWELRWCWPSSGAKRPTGGANPAERPMKRRNHTLRCHKQR